MSTILAPSAIVIPGSFVNVCVCVVLSTCIIAHVLLDLTFVVLAITQKYFCLSIKYLKPIKATLNNFIRITIKNTNALGFSISPLSLVNRSVCKKTDTLTVSEIIFKLTFEFGARRIYNLAQPVFQAFAYDSFVYFVVD
jgi:hypothetical protein